MTVYVLVSHEDPQNDGGGRISLPVRGVFASLQDARQAEDHDDNTIFALDEEEARNLVENFEHDVKKSYHGMWCETCSSTVARAIYPVDMYDCPNQPTVDL